MADESPQTRSPVSEMIAQRKRVEVLINQAREEVHEKTSSMGLTQEFLDLQREFGLAKLITLIALS